MVIIDIWSNFNTLEIQNYITVNLLIYIKDDTFLIHVLQDMDKHYYMTRT